MLAVVCILPSVFHFEEPLVMSSDKETRQSSNHQEDPLSQGGQGPYPSQVSSRLDRSLSGSLALAGR